MYDHILVGTDGSDAANRAVEFALDLAEQYDATVHAIDVVDTRRYGEPALSSSELVLNEIEERAHRSLAEVEVLAEATGVVLETRCCHGDPLEEILAFGDEIDADVLVLGYQGQTHSGDRIGSVANKLINETDRPVLLT